MTASVLSFMLPCATRNLLRRQNHHHLTTLESRFAFDFGHRLRLGLHAIQHFHAEMLMRHLTAAKPQRDFDLVAFFEEAPDRAHFHVIVMIVDAGTHLDLFDLDDLLILACFRLLLLLLVLVLAVIQDFADRRLRIGRDLDKIETGVGCSLHGIQFADDSDVLSSFVDQSHFTGPDLVVDLRASRFARRRGSHRFADGSNSSCCFNARLADIGLPDGYSPPLRQSAGRIGKIGFQVKRSRDPTTRLNHRFVDARPRIGLPDPSQGSRHTPEASSNAFAVVKMTRPHAPAL
jgi:hypothetical protein